MEEKDCVETCISSTKQEELGDHCYNWSMDEETWQDAENKCKEEMKGGHLAAVTNKTIYEFLMEKVDWRKKTWFWIGGYNYEEDEEWRWSDGSRWEFENWADDPHQQPNNHEGNQHCVQIYNRKWAKNGWNDQHCDNEYGFICSAMLCPKNEITQTPGLLYFATSLMSFYRA